MISQATTGPWPHDLSAQENCADWHVLVCGFGLGRHFFETWHAWHNAHLAPRRLFYTAIEPSPASAADIQAYTSSRPEWADGVHALIRAWWGLLPGTHRLVLEGGRLQFTLHVGSWDNVLPTLDAQVDSICLLHPEDTPGEVTAPPLMRALGRLSRPGTRLVAEGATPQTLAHLVSAGFVPTPDVQAGPAHALHTVYAPSWTPAKTCRARLGPGQHTALVVGGGLAGAAAAHSLAERGWQVTVLDAAQAPASGASALPGGMVAPHVSPDDALLSRLSRAGVRMTLERAARLLQPQVDWALSGVLEHRVDAPRGLPRTAAWQRWGSDWSRPAEAQEQEACGLKDDEALWHVHAGWIRPAALVQAQLRHPRIEWRGGQEVLQLERTPHGWRALGLHGPIGPETQQVVLATAWHTRALLAALGHSALPLNPLRGQITWGPLAALSPEDLSRLPPFPVNGHGALLHGVPGPDGHASWLVGSTFERAMPHAWVRPEDRAANLHKLRRLLPPVGDMMAPHFKDAHDWAGVRCTLPDRFPAVGPVAPHTLPGLNICTGLGARGLTLSVLCGELLAAQLHGEPWPVERTLAHRLMAGRFSKG